MRIMDYELLGKRIRRQRQDVGWTQEQLAERINVSTSYVGHIERGSRKASIDTLVDIANAMGVTADYLLGANLVHASGSLMPDHLNAARLGAYQEILTTMQNQLDKWLAGAEGDQPSKV